MISKKDFIRGLHERVDQSVPTIEDLYAIKTYLRKWALLVGVYDDPTPDFNGIYLLDKGRSSNNIQDNGNWVQLLQSSNVEHNIGTTNYQTPLPPDPYSVNVGDTWTELTTGSHFRLTMYSFPTDFSEVFDDTFSLLAVRFWVETTSPGKPDPGLETFTNTFDITFDRAEDIDDEWIRIWDNSFDNTFGSNPLRFDLTFDLTYN